MTMMMAWRTTSGRAGGQGMAYGFETLKKQISQEGGRRPVTENVTENMQGSGRRNIEFRREMIKGSAVAENGIPEALTRGGVYTFTGRQGAERARFCLNEKIMSTHILEIGGIGAGKTNVYNGFFDQLKRNMTASDVALIFDTKGDAIRRCGRAGDIVIGNSRMYRSVTSYWNSFKEMEAAGDEMEEQELMAREIAAFLFSDRKNESQPFFSDAARDIFGDVAIHFWRKYKESPGIWRGMINNQELIKFFRQSDVKQLLGILEANPDFRGHLNYLGDGTSKQALGVLGELYGMISTYFIGIFAKSTQGRDISMQDLVQKKGGKRIFIEYDLRTGEVLTPVYRLLVDMALKAAMSRTRSEGQVYVIADELKLLPKLEHLCDALNFGRSLGVRVMASIQSIEQLYDAYGETEGAVIAAGFSSMIAFRTPDAVSREFISKHFGKNYYMMHYWDGAGNWNGDVKEGMTVEEWELMALDVGDAVVGINGYPPFLFHFDEY